MRFTKHTVLFSALTLLLPLTITALWPSDIVIELNSLASETDSLLNAIASAVSTNSSSALATIWAEFDHEDEDIENDIKFTLGSPILLKEDERHFVLDAYSKFTATLLDLTDSIANNATALIALGPTAVYKFPAALRILWGIVDAYLFILISLFPPDTVCYVLANSLKDQVDAGFQNAIDAFPPLF